MSKEVVNKEQMELIFDALHLANEIEEVLDGKELLIILMALTKVSGVMLAEAHGMLEEMKDESSAVMWFGRGMAAAYRGHAEFLKQHEGSLH